MRPCVKCGKLDVDSARGMCKCCRNKEYRKTAVWKTAVYKKWVAEYNRRPEVAEKRRVWQRKQWDDPVKRAKMMANKKKYYARPDVKERQKKYMREYLQRPEVKKLSAMRSKKYVHSLSGCINMLKTDKRRFLDRFESVEAKQAFIERVIKTFEKYKESDEDGKVS
jgi:hypothetical protein